MMATPPRQKPPGAAYGTPADLARYLGARSTRTGRRWVAELRARGLRAYVFGGRLHFRFREVDQLLASEAAE